MKYRAEVDGLRAVAVVPVILFHAGFSAFSGGFVGVDVFFVISGYLITSIILAELEHGRFSIVNFYERRARRILPALFFVLLACLPFAWMWLLPGDLRSLSQSLVAVTAFASNILFWREQGYFDTAAELKPLLHTWSLAVEEQFYVFFPLFLLLAWRVGKRWIMVTLTMVGLVSLALAQWASAREPGAAFYLLPTRGWELLIGAAAAFYFAHREHPPFGRNIAEAGSAAGLVLIAVGVFTFDKHTPFPGVYALAPTLGALLIILFASPATIVGRLLASKTFVWIGLLSYSAYLWHQPLFAFARHRSINEPPAVLFAALAVASLALAFLSWKFVETPFRNKQAVSRRQVFAFSLAGTAVFAAAGLAGHLSSGFPERVEAGVRYLADFEEQNRARNVSACRRAPDEYPAQVACVVGDASQISGALVGDSHAGAMLHAMNQALAGRGIGLLNINLGCPPVRGLYRVDLGQRQDCDAHNRKVFDYLAGQKQIEHVVMTARWSLYLDRGPYNNGEGGVEPGDDAYVDVVENGVRLKHDEPTRRALVKDKYRQAVLDYLGAGKNVVLVYPVPEVGWDVPAVIGKRALFGAGAGGDLTHSYEAYLRRSKDAIEAFDSLGERPGLTRVYPEKFFCNTHVSGRCVAQWKGAPMYFDDDHLSNDGAALIAAEIVGHLGKSSPAHVAR